MQFQSKKQKKLCFPTSFFLLLRAASCFEGQPGRPGELVRQWAYQGIMKLASTDHTPQLPTFDLRNFTSRSGEYARCRGRNETVLLPSSLWFYGKYPLNAAVSTTGTEMSCQ
jgi:hypothetical protein